MGEALIRLDVRRLPEGGWLATSEGVPGLVAQSRTIAETLQTAQDVARKLAEACIEHGDPLPPALAEHAPQRFHAQVALGAL